VVKNFLKPWFRYFYQKENLVQGFFLKSRSSNYYKALRKFVVYVEATLYLSISLLEIGRDIMPTSQGWERNYAYL